MEKQEEAVRIIEAIGTTTLKWDYRILAYEYDGEVYFQIHQVYYNEEGKPAGYVESPASVGSKEVKGVRRILNKMPECLEKPILWAGKKFPNE